jgi:putative Holliday junction resolvase
MRLLGVDFGQRRLGLALSDATATLARPWRTVPASATPAASAAALADLIRALRDQDDAEAGDIGEIVVGLPKRLNGEDTDQTQPARDFTRVLGDRSGLPVHLQDERLSSHEADRLLAERERDWRRRKAQLDAASAAIILQDFLDARARLAALGQTGDRC